MIDFDWTHLFIISKDLHKDTIKNPQSIYIDAKFRTIVNRAYYASFCKSRRYLENILGDKNIPTDGTAHNYIPNKFISTREYSFKTLGKKLKSLFIWRKAVDYDDTVDELSLRAIDSLDIAEKIIEILNSKVLKVSGLEKNISEEEIKEHFSEFGKVDYIKLKKEEGICFLTMSCLAEADKAKVLLNESKIKQNTIKVEKAIP